MSPFPGRYRRLTAVGPALVGGLVGVVVVVVVGVVVEVVVGIQGVPKKVHDSEMML